MAKAKTPLLVKMMRDEPQFEGGPLTATVHPDEVENYQQGGWVINTEEKSDTSPAGAVGDSGDATQAPGSDVDESGDGDGDAS